MDLIIDEKYYNKRSRVVYILRQYNNTNVWIRIFGEINPMITKSKYKNHPTVSISIKRFREQYSKY